MALSKVMMASTNSRNPDLTRRPPCSSKPPPEINSDCSTYNPDRFTQCSDHLQYHQPETKPSNSNLESTMTLDGLLRSVYGEDPFDAMDNTLLNDEIDLIDAAGAISAVGDCGATHAEASIRRQNSYSGSGGSPKTVDDIWKEIVSGKSERKECKVEMPETNEMMTLEEFLARAEAADEGDVKEPPIPETLSGGIFAFDPMNQSSYAPQAMIDMGFGNGAEVVGGVGRGKKRAGNYLDSLDKAAQQRQKRMIKNRESAARSRERKQAYQYELESLVAKLEEENEQLRREKAQRTKERLNQLMETVVPVVERRGPRRMLRRVHSMQW